MKKAADKPVDLKNEAIAALFELAHHDEQMKQAIHEICNFVDYHAREHLKAVLLIVRKYDGNLAAAISERLEQSI